MREMSDDVVIKRRMPTDKATGPAMLNKALRAAA